MGVETILQTLELVPEYLRLIGLTDLLDMAIIAFGIYHLFRFVRRSRSGQVVKAILFIVAAMALANLPQLHLRVVRTVLNNAVELGVNCILLPAGVPGEIRERMEAALGTRAEEMDDYIVFALF